MCHNLDFSDFSSCVLLNGCKINMLFDKITQVMCVLSTLYHILSFCPISSGDAKFDHLVQGMSTRSLHCKKYFSFYN